MEANAFRGQKGEQTKPGVDRHVFVVRYFSIGTPGQDKHYSIAEGDNVDFLKDPMTLQTESSNHEIM